MLYRYNGIIDVPQGGNQFITASYCSRFNFSFYPQKIRNETYLKKSKFTSVSSVPTVFRLLMKNSF